MEFLKTLFSSGDFMPHGYCYLWDRGLVLLHLISDVLIALAYFSIPITLVYFVRKRRDLPFHWMFLCFGVFIIACGSTHVMEVWTLWHANYWLAGIVKAVTALASVPTAILLVQLVPKALVLPSPDELTELNQDLAKQTGQLARANAELAAANRALQQSEERYRLLFDSNPHPLWVYDLKTLAFLDVNHSATRKYGYSRGEFLSLTIKDIRPPEDIPALTESVGKTSGDTESAGIWRHRRKDGTLIDVDITSHPLVFDGKDARLVVATDITLRKQTEEKLKQRTSELEATNKELEAFSYSVSHDLRAPLRSIDGFTLALAEDYSDKLDEQGQDYIRRVRAATQRMGLLIDDLLNLSRVTRAEMHRERVNLTAVAESIVVELRKTDPQREVEVAFEKEIEVFGDPQLLRIALDNLLANAWKYTSKNPRARIEFGKTQCDGGVAYFVRDDGVGFDSAYADRLFGAFQRLHGGTEFPGNGVGLATVQRIIHRHGGHVWAEGTVGKGATFYFTL